MGSKSEKKKKKVWFKYENIPLKRTKLILRPEFVVCRCSLKKLNDSKRSKLKCL